MKASFVDQLRNEREVGVPRRFSIGTIFVLLTLYGILFRLLVLLGAAANWTALICLFFGIVTVSQMMLFHGARPRAASLVSGMVACPLLLVAVAIDEMTSRWTGWTPLAGGGGLDRVDGFVSAILLLAMLGLPLGYMVGGTTAGVFYVLGKLLPKSTISGVAFSEESELPDSPAHGWARRIGGWLSPIQLKSPVRGAIAIFLLMSTFGVLLSPFVLWAAQHHVIILAVGIGLCLAFWSGNFQLWMHWPIVLGVLGALVAGLAADQLQQAAFFQTVFEQQPKTVHIVLRIAGFLTGLTLSALAGWLQWVWYQRTDRRFGLWHLAGFAALVLAGGALTAQLAAAWVRTPVQQLYRDIHQEGGYVLWDWSLQPRSLALPDAFGDEDLHLLRPMLNDCYEVSFEGPGFTDRSVQLLDGLNLQFIVIRRASTTDDMFAGMKNFSPPCVLLQAMDVGDKAVADLIALPLTTSVLEQLYLGDTKITDDGLSQLKACQALRILSLDDCAITGQGLANLAGHRRLERLSLTGCPIQDDDLTVLGGLPNLMYLTLDNTDVTDRGLLNLTKLNRLRHVQVKGTQVTAAGVERFKEVMPGCAIRWDDPSD